MQSEKNGKMPLKKLNDSEILEIKAVISQMLC